MTCNMAHATVSLHKPAVTQALRGMFEALAAAGVENPVAYGIGVSELDKTGRLGLMNVLAVLPEHGTRGLMEAFTHQGLTPVFRAGANEATQILLTFKDYDVALRLREAAVVEQPRKQLRPLTAADLAGAPAIAAHQIAVNAHGQVIATEAYVAATRQQNLRPTQGLRAFA